MMEAAMVAATAVMAVFTVLIWLIRRDEHKRTHFALLEWCAGKAVYNSTNREVRLEVLMLNRSGAPAVLQGFEALIRDGQFQQSMADGERSNTQYIKAPVRIGGSGIGWVVHRETPTALALTKTAGQALTSRATVEVEIQYAGGKGNSMLKRSVPVDRA